MSYWYGQICTTSCINHEFFIKYLKVQLLFAPACWNPRQSPPQWPTVSRLRECLVWAWWWWGTWLPISIHSVPVISILSVPSGFCFLFFNWAELRRCLFTQCCANWLGRFSAWTKAPEASILDWERTKHMVIVPQSPMPAHDTGCPCQNHIFPAQEISFFFSMAW